MRALAYAVLMGLFELTASTHSKAVPPAFFYEGDRLPEEAGWEILQVYCNPMLSVDYGAFIAAMHPCPGDPPGSGQQAAYARQLDEFIGIEHFFLEWRVETDGPNSELIFGAPIGIGIGGLDGVHYIIFVSRDMARFNRDNFIPEVWVTYEPGVHVFRLELHGPDSYVLMIDNEIRDQGTPEGSFPAYEPDISWVSRARHFSNVTSYDYVRYGPIPTESSGDFDSDGDIDRRDWYYFRECTCGCVEAESLDLLHPDAPTHCNCATTDAGPSCRWADLDGDGDIDFADFGAFQRMFTGGDND